MQDEQYFIRRRGRVTGPYDFDTVQKMVQTGKLYKSDELSLDQVEWVTASDTEFFPEKPKQGESKVLKTVTIEPFESGATSHGVINSPPQILWYYALNDQSLGPIKEVDLIQQFQMNSMGPKTKVWRDGMPQWEDAGNHPAFSHVFAIQPFATQPPAMIQHTQNQPTSNATSRILQGKYCISCGEVISQRASICTKCGSTQADALEPISTGFIIGSYLVTFLIPIAGIFYAIYYSNKSRIGHAIGNVALMLCAFGFWITFISFAFGFGFWTAFLAAVLK